jgi:hypothetical protein
MGPGKRTSSATVDAIHSFNKGQGLYRDGKVNACSQSHDQSSVACMHPSKFLKVEVDGTETHKMVSQVFNLIDCRTPDSMHNLTCILQLLVCFQSKQARKMVVEAPSVTKTDSTGYDSDSIDGTSSWSGSEGDEVETFSDAMIFRYCLEGTYERSTFLKDAASCINVDDFVALANQVSLYSGCSHHRYSYTLCFTRRFLSLITNIH